MHFRFPLLSSAITPQLQLCLCFGFSAVSPTKKKNTKNWKLNLQLPAKLTVSHVTYVLLRNSKKLEKWWWFRSVFPFGKASAGLENELCSNNLIEISLRRTYRFWSCVNSRTSCLHNVHSVQLELSPKISGWHHNYYHPPIGDMRF